MQPSSGDMIGEPISLHTYVECLVGATDFFFFMVSRWSLGPTQLSAQWEPGIVFLGVEWAGHESGHTHLVLRLRMVELHLHFAIYPHAMVLN
jgi:hypothetical protein